MGLGDALTCDLHVHLRFFHFAGDQTFEGFRAAAFGDAIVATNHVLLAGGTPGQMILVSV
jgi:hypothetical protein